MLAGPAAAADVAGVCGKIDDPNGKVTVVQSRGHATVTITTGPSANAAARRNPFARVDYDGETYTGRYENNGQAVISFALLATENKMTVRPGDFGPVKCDVSVPDLDKYYRVIMRWHDPVRLDLHVVEPGRRTGGYGDIRADVRNLTLDKGLGQMDVVTDAGENGTTGEQSYVIDESARPKEEAGFTVRVDYTSRGGHPEPRFCGTGPAASVALSLIVLDKGKKSSSREYEIASVPCGQAIADDQRAIRLR